jgi:hypothetical protein
VNHRDETNPDTARGWPENSVRPHSVRDRDFDSLFPQQSLQSPSCPQDCPRPANPHGTEIVNGNARGKEFLAQSTRKAQPEFRFHRGAQLSQLREGDQQSFDPAKEITGREMQYLHAVTLR